LLQSKTNRLWGRNFIEGMGLEEGEEKDLPHLKTSVPIKEYRTGGKKEPLVRPKLFALPSQEKRETKERKGRSLTVLTLSKGGGVHRFLPITERGEKVMGTLLPLKKRRCRLPIGTTRISSGRPKQEKRGKEEVPFRSSFFEACADCRGKTETKGRGKGGITSIS